MLMERSKLCRKDLPEGVEGTDLDEVVTSETRLSVKDTINPANKRDFLSKFIYLTIRIIFGSLKIARQNSTVSGPNSTLIFLNSSSYLPVSCK